ncbi:agamous-like MADS-box protein AGL29 [Solanum pennellii]|uniref:Agamous-like MADS-box protein AGL29 n=1 Tax=Solanum pennellii TaxID=28526 RepID=A0ABM1HMB2_SOLPN|nr:agamous-like MADS-box protein AGL29 [Solanum pennellii]
MENETKKGKQKIEMKLIENERARMVSFSKRKRTLFEDAHKFATRAGADVGVMLFSPSGKPYSNDSATIADIIDRFLKMKQEDHKRDYAEGESNGFEALKDLHKELQAWNDKEKKRILMHKIMHPGSEIPSDKHMEEQKLALKLKVEKFKNEIQSAIMTEHLKFDLNVVPDPKE